MAQERGNTVKSIAETFNICRKTVNNYLKINEEKQTFVPATDKCRNTCVQRNSMFTNMEKTIYNAIACENSLILPEVQNIVREQNNTDVSTATISRILGKMKITRKRLTMVPRERKTREKIAARAVYAAEISNIHDENLLFLDES
ncbi:hypothetical protein RF11_11669 [Thelohanellus kitauei]|uniref:Transposase Tc1-like domain-containing protein n=1 Tax=Thelohanellus kitauei TaxID=669202 RepID=A0A0C2ML50_THEKT|nr:hypothetical protein RF11_11669 [Thelohanellus kitauei]